MSLSTLQQNEEIDSSVTYDDTLTMANAESSAVSLEDDLNYLRTQFQAMLGETNWFDPPDETINDLAARAKLEDKLILCRALNLTVITVGASNNFVTLTGAGEAPSQVIAINATTEGAIVAQLAGAVGSHALDEVTGINAVSPKNLLHIYDDSTGQPLQDSSGKDIYGLLQVGNLATDGNSFATSGNDLAQISFVVQNGAGNDLIACAVSDIENKTLRYTYLYRTDLQNADEQCFDSSGIPVDASASVDVTLQNAINNQIGEANQGAKDIDIRIDDNQEWQFSDSLGNGLLTVFALAAGDEVHIGDGTSAALLRGHGQGLFDDSVTVDNDGQAINIGSTAGRIDSSSLEIESLSGDLNFDSAAELYFADSRDTTPVPWSSGTADFASLTGGTYASLMDALEAALTGGGSTFSRADGNTTTTIAANTLIRTGVNLSNALLDYWDTDSATTATRFVNNVLIFINGRYRRPGANASANNDVYPTTVEAEANDGAFFHEALTKNNANIMMMLFD